MLAGLVKQHWPNHYWFMLLLISYPCDKKHSNNNSWFWWCWRWKGSVCILIIISCWKIKLPFELAKLLCSNHSDNKGICRWLMFCWFVFAFVCLMWPIYLWPCLMNISKCISRVVKTSSSKRKKIKALWMLNIMSVCVLPKHPDEKPKTPWRQLCHIQVFFFNYYYTQDSKGVGFFLFVIFVTPKCTFLHEVNKWSVSLTFWEILLWIDTVVPPHPCIFNTVIHQRSPSFVSCIFIS